MIKAKEFKTGAVAALLLRMLTLLIIYALCRVLFYFKNSDFIGAIEWSDVIPIIKGSFVYDTISILYTNIAFVVLSLLPFRFVSSKGYVKFLMVLFIITNTVALLFAVGDIYYYEFKLARAASDDLQYFTQGNATNLAGGFLIDYFGAALLWIGSVVLTTWVSFKLIVVDRKREAFGWIFYPIRAVVLAIAVLLSIVAIRGFSISKATFPISMADATRYVKAEHASLILSNPFCIIRTLSTSTPSLHYFDENRSQKLFPLVHKADSSSVRFADSKPNIMLIVLESFGSAHIKPLTDSFDANRDSYTPFLDSLMEESMLFTNCFQSGLRSIDAMPAMWSSIPTFGRHFLSMPQSVGSYKALPEILKEMGYSTSFHHGANSNSLSFRSFGNMVGVDNYYMQEEYESAYGKDDFDGYWGIWDHKFLPFTVENLSKESKPFFATLFTLSSHNPYDLPSGFENRFKKGTMEIHELISYSDYALEEFFRLAKEQPWFDNTLFILTGDHGSGADNPKWLSLPYSHKIPLILYMPSASLRGVDNRVVSHIDIMPTLLGMLGYEDEYFAFGSDIFAENHRAFAATYSNNSYCLVDDEIVIAFDGESISSVYNYLNYDNKNLLGTIDIEAKSDSLKAYLQNYYERLKMRNYQPE